MAETTMQTMGEDYRARLEDLERRADEVGLTAEMRREIFENSDKSCEENSNDIMNGGLVVVTGDLRKRMLTDEYRMEQRLTKLEEAVVKREEEMRLATDFGDDFDFRPEKNRLCLRIENAKKLLEDSLRLLLKSTTPIWVAGYDKVAGWMKDNRGKGLALVGTTGTGKTTVFKAIHMVLQGEPGCNGIKMMTARNLNKGKRAEDAIASHVLFLDDVGVEGTRNDYGNRSMAFADIVDNAERKGHTLVITSNYSWQELEAKYGEPVTDRLKALCEIVVMTGKSMRQ